MKEDTEVGSSKTKMSKSKTDGANSQGKGLYDNKKNNENEITSIRYIKDIGLVATAFNGTIKIFDAFNFY